MKNREYYAEQIIDIALRNQTIGLVNGAPFACSDIACDKCELNHEDGCINEAALLAWSEKEYQEGYVDWSTVEVDTPVLVRNTDIEPWQERYFAFYINGKVYTWQYDKKSTETNDVLWWYYAKLK